MPWKQRKPCAYPGCPELVEAGERYCEKHRKKTAKAYERFERDPETKRRYGRAWKRVRDRYISRHPLCEICFEEGRTVEAEEVHHRVPLSEGGTNDEENLQALCKSCHSKIHLARGDRRGRPKEYKK